MKKIISVLLILLVAAAAGYYFYMKRNGPLGDMKAAEYLPAETIALIEITDLNRSKVRWKETALYKISQEPAVQAFLEKPKSLAPHDAKMDERMQHLEKADPKEIFIAAAGQSAGEPKVVAGFDFKGNKADAEALIAELKSNLKDSHPEGKSDIQKYESVEIETYSFDQTVYATVFKGPWFFASNDLELLKSTLNRLDGKADVKTSLRENSVYQASLAKLPKDSDAMLFVQMKPLLDPLAPVMSMLDPKQVEAFKKIQGISAAFKFDGEKLRDAFYVYMPGGKAQSPMARNALAYTSADTLLFFAAALNLENAPVLPNPEMDSTGFLGVLDVMRQTLSQAGLGFDDFKSAFGPEIGTVMNWGAEDLKPGWIISLDVRDKAKAQKFIEALTSSPSGAGTWPKQEIDGTLFYSKPSEGFIPIAPVLALTDKSVLFGIDINSVKEAIVSTAKPDAPRLDKTPGFLSVAQAAIPTGAYGYLDTAKIFERVYAAAALPLKMMAAFNPNVSSYGDLNKLPPAEAISKHLGPMTYSQSTNEDGLFIESSGPLTFNEVILAVGLTAGFYSEQHMAAPPVQTFPNMPAAPAPGLPDPADTTPATPAQPAPANP